MRFFPSFRLKHKILLWFSVLMGIIIMTISVTSYWISAKATQEIVTNYVVDMLLQVSKSLETNMEETDSIINSLLIDESFCSFFRNMPEGKYERARLKSMIENRLRAASKVKRDIGNMYIVTNTGEIFSNNAITTPNQYILGMPWREEIAQGTGRLVISPTDVGTLSGTSPKIETGKYFSIIRPAREIASMISFGMIAVDINVNLIDQISFSRDSGRYRGDLMIIDQNANIVYSQTETGKPLDLLDDDAIQLKKSGTYIETMNGVPTLIVFESCDKYGWKLIEFVPMGTILSPAQKIRNGIIIIGLCSLLVLFLVSYILARSVTQPLTILQQKMKNVEMGNLELEGNFEQNDEVGQLAVSLKTMLARLRDSLEEIYDKEQEKRDLEITLLQHQIYPHFLYNTLDSINWLARMQGAKTISAMITALNRMLRISIYNGDRMNTIGEEIDCVESFVQLRTLSYQQPIQMAYAVDENLLDCLIPKMTLQPLVENAIQHGFDGGRENAQITLSVEQIDGRIVIRIADNGKGIEEADLDALLDGLQEKRSMFSAIGIKNIRQRLNLYFDALASLEITSVPNLSTVVRITMPVRRRHAHD